MERKATYRMTEMAILTALSIVLLLLIQFPIFPATPYLKYDMADVPVILGGLLLGPLPGLLILALAAAIQAFLIVGDGIIGFVMHFLASSILMLLPALFFRHSAKKSNVIVGGVLGVVAMAAMMAFWNLIFTPIYTGMPRSAIVPLLLPAIVPFNLIKGGVNMLISFVLYHALLPVHRRVYQH
ncbi:MAG: ECF transporter S component [Oscillospiraceae bacterium]|nr:ECF transporter S component [Oscillospiraceae bacterium]MDD4367368.1 ECF transporter S component [Oscillospiraceae bacterium]